MLKSFLNEYLKVKDNFKSAKTYANYVARFDAVIGGGTETRLQSIIQQKPSTLKNNPGYDPIADVMDFFDSKSSALSNYKSKTIYNWRRGFKDFSTVILGKYYANTWLFSNISDLNLCKMVASNAIFADRDVVFQTISGQLGTNSNITKKGNPEACWDHYERCRDNKIKKGSTTTDCNGIPCIADDNTYANRAVKMAVLHGSSFAAIRPRKDISLFKDYEACHIWGFPDDCHYYTSIINLVLLPKAIAGLSDHCDAVKGMLKYRSYELYGILLPGQTIPPKPNDYNKIVWRK